MKPVNTVTTSSTSPCNMNEPNTINTVSMDGGMPCLRDGWINYYWRAVTRSDTWTQWKVEGGRKSSRDVPAVTVEDRATWLIGFDEFSFRDDTKNLTTGCSILRLNSKVWRVLQWHQALNQKSHVVNFTVENALSLAECFPVSQQERAGVTVEMEWPLLP